VDAKDQEKMTIILSCLSDTNEHHKTAVKKEYVKILGLMAEILVMKMLIKHLIICSGAY
jgi:hypothetical protein